MDKNIFKTVDRESCADQFDIRGIRLEDADAAFRTDELGAEAGQVSQIAANVVISGAGPQMVSKHERYMGLKVAGFGNSLSDEVVFEHKDFEAIFRRYENLVCRVVGPPFHFLDRRQKDLARIPGLTTNAPRARHGVEAAIDELIKQRREHGAIYKRSRPIATMGAYA